MVVINYSSIRAVTIWLFELHFNLKKTNCSVTFIMSLCVYYRYTCHVQRV